MIFSEFTNNQLLADRRNAFAERAAHERQIREAQAGRKAMNIARWIAAMACILAKPKPLAKGE
jgi:hypothetical protein